MASMGAESRNSFIRPYVNALLRYVAQNSALGGSGAPAGAVIGEWVGASSGLGYLMLNANARVRTDVMFAALVVLSAMTVGLWWLTDRVLRRVLYWQPE